MATSYNMMLHNVALPRISEDLEAMSEAASNHTLNFPILDIWVTDPYIFPISDPISGDIRQWLPISGADIGADSGLCHVGVMSE